MARLEWAVPRTLDELPRFFFLDLHQLIGVVVFISLGMVGGSLLIGLLTGALFAKGYSCMRAGRHPQFIMHMVYWYLPAWVLQLRRTPPAHLRLYLG